MKYYIVLILLISSLKTEAQSGLEPFEIKGNVTGSLPIKYFRLAIRYKGTASLQLASDSIPVVNKEFIITGKIAHPYSMHLFYDDGNEYFSSKLFFFDKGKHILNINTDSIQDSIPDIQGSKTHDEYLRYFNTKDLIQLEKKLNDYGDTVEVNNETIIIYAKMKQNRNENRDEILLKNTIAHPDNIIPAWLMLDYMQRKGFGEKYFEIYKRLKNSHKNTPFGNYVLTTIKNASSISIGANFPNLNLKNIDLLEHLTNVIDTSKKYTLIDFWFAKCGPCIAQFESFIEVFSKYHQKGLDIITISTDKEKAIDDWRTAIKKHELPWTQFLDMGGIEAKRLQINSFPTNFLLDQSGKIIKKNIDIEELKILLDRSLL